MFHDIPQPILERMAFLEEIDQRDRQDDTPRLHRGGMGLVPGLDGSLRSPWNLDRDRDQRGLFGAVDLAGLPDIRPAAGDIRGDGGEDPACAGNLRRCRSRRCGRACRR